MCTDVVAMEIEYQVGVAVGHPRGFVEAGGDIDHRIDSKPCGDAIEISQGTLQAAEVGKGHHACRRIALCGSHVGPDLAERFSDASVRILGDVPRDLAPAS